ncbi:MAG: NAD-dependent 4,6-dehydratase LegB [Methylocystaceae bacterium]
MDLNGKRVLVTGADGFIGSHLAERLLTLGCKVRAFTLYNSFNSWGWLDTIPQEKQNKLEIFAGDVRDPHGVKRAMQDCEVVFHLAALIGIPYSYHSPDAYVDTNIKGTLNVLQAARELGTLRIVHTSTSEVYGTAQYVPINEEHPLQGQSPYAATKIGADQLTLSFYRSFGTPVSVIRPFNTYGPRQSTRAVIPTIITQIAQGKTEIELGSLHPTRDFSYVKDTVNGFIAVSQADSAVGQVVNIGSNFEVSIGELVTIIADVMKVDVKVKSRDNRMRPALSEVERLWADNLKARELTGWEPLFAGKDGLFRGLSETAAWFTNKNNLSRYRMGEYTK